MPLQNRVRPDGEIVAHPARGLFMGNRGGRIHVNGKRLGGRRWAGKTWICCVTSFKRRRREVMGHGYTELFFLDEATALAAGHRPCFECRRADAIRFADLWRQATGGDRRLRAAEMDAALHVERLAPGGAKRMHEMRARDLPGGAMISCGERILLHHAGWYWPWSPDGYGAPERTTFDTCAALTPPAILAVLGAGYRPVLHASLDGDMGRTRGQG